MARISEAKTYFDTNKALEELNMPQTPISFAVRACAHWFIKNGYVASKNTYQDKVFVITGSAQGVENTLAHTLLSRGAKVVLNGRSTSKAKAMLEEFAYAGDSAAYIAADVSSEAECQSLIEQAIQQFGKIDFLVNNAGMFCYGDLEDTASDVIKQVFDSNVMGSVYLSKAALPQLKQQKGGVLFISSLAALNGLGGHAIYSAAKVAMVSLAQSLKKELHKTGVFVGYTYLGFTENDSEKRTLNPQGELEVIPSRPGIKPMPQHLAVLKILKQIEAKRYFAIHSLMGKTFYGISRLSELLANMILLRGYRAEKAFLEAVNSQLISVHPSERHAM